MPKIVYPVLLVSHDAGGANVLAAWAMRNLDWDRVSLLLGGPAKGIFNALTDTFNQVEFDELALEKYRTIITSTSREDIFFERKIIKAAHDRDMYIISMLDHWINYDDRFVVSDKIYWPNEILVNDVYAKERIESISGCPKVSVVRNYYLEDQVAKITALKKMPSTEKRGFNHYLFVCEPSTDERYTEFEILSHFLAALETKADQSTQAFKVKVRLHPREPIGKYDKVIEPYIGFVRISKDSTLYEDIAWADTVVGCQTMAMVIALYAGCKVYSSLPLEVECSALPHTEIPRWF